MENNTYYVAHRKIGYIVDEELTIEEAREVKVMYGRFFAIYNENGIEVK